VAGLHYYDMGKRGERYPEVITCLRKARGVYAIRDKHSHQVLYVGSSANALYGTITRHLQDWKRAKKFWSRQYARGPNHDPGTTYNRASVEVAMHVLRHDQDQRELEADWIERFEPRDNLVSNPDGQGRYGDDGDVPF
jgi:excinuclease UvrABC nuclease subunit